MDKDKRLSNEPTNTVDLLTETSKTLQDRQSARKRLPLTRVFSSALISFIVLFVVITLLAYSRLIDFRLILQDITEKSVPSIALSGRIYNQVNTLTYLTEGLTKTQSVAASRIANQNIKTQLAELKSLAATNSADPYLQVQLDALELELDELASLVEQRLNSEALFTEKLDSLYGLYDQIAEIAESQRTSTNNSRQNDWTLTVAEIVALAGKTASRTRLHKLRLLAEKINEKLAIFERQIRSLPSSQKESVRDLSDTLRKVLLGDTGLLNLRIDQLRIAGRTIGRGNFVRNLVLDYARMAEFQSYQLNDSVIAETQATSVKINEQIRFIGLATGLAILFLISIVYFLQFKVVNRLKRLNELVNQKLQGQSAELTVSGNDEISDIAQTFDAFARTVAEQNRKLHDLSLSDSLTGIANRRAFDERFEQEMMLAKRQSWPVSILLIDVDFFKLFNDSYGHATGDICLQKIAETLEQHMQRHTDFVARYGGEEFVCILPDTNEDGAINMAVTLLDAIRGLKVPHETSLVSKYITASIGIRTFHFSPTQNIAQGTLLEQADQALYQAKETGRNGYQMFSPK